jgi:UPF0755 protein
MIKKILFIILVLAPLLIVASIGGYITMLFNQTYTGPDKTFTVRNGDTFGRINQRLFDDGLIQDKRIFHYYAKYKNVMTKFRAGSFTITTGSNMSEVLETLLNGQPNLSSITVPEGKNMYEVAKIFAASGITSEKEFLEAVQHPDMISKLNINAQSLEGYLYPETYRFAPKTPATSIVKSMIDLFHERTKNLNFDHPFLNKHQVIILASVVEKETGAKVERPMIAGVFTNRLKKRMRLQSDPTTVYGIWSRYTGNIRKADLLEITPYNTYKIPALPQGPISNPGLDAIKAVLNPSEHDYLYFVSRNDGTHIFSKTYQDHEKAVEDFQVNANARKGKSWRDLKQN